MKMLLFLFVSALLVGTSWAQNCTATATFTQDVPDWTYIKIKLQLEGTITVIDGGDIENTQIIVDVQASTQEEADKVAITSYFPEVDGGIVFTITNNVTAEIPPLSEAEEEAVAESESSGSRNKISMALGVGAALFAATRNSGAALASIPVTYMLSTSVAEAAGACLKVQVTVKVPSGVVTATGMVVPTTGYANLTSGEIIWAYGIVDISNCSNCAGSYPCNSGNSAGQCQSVSSCVGKNTIAGLCPGAKDIQCCISSYGSCCGNGKVGTCKDQNTCASGGTTVTGACPGTPANIKCCIPSGAPNCATSAGNPRQTASVPFAKIAGTFWPLKQTTRSTICFDDASGANDKQVPTSPIASSYGCSTRKFFAGRSGGRYHSGIDLYATAGTEVRAIASGTIVNTYAFFENVCCVILQTDYGEVHNYGEISCNYKVRTGQRVSAGQQIGFVGDLQCCSAMLHFETYKQGTTSNQKSYPGSVSSRVLNPTKLLLHLRQNGQ